MSTPKQIEQWRKDFEADVLSGLGASLGKEHDLWRGTHYYNALTNSHWETYRKRAEHELALHAQKDSRIAELELQLSMALDAAEKGDEARRTAGAQDARIAELEVKVQQRERAARWLNEKLANRNEQVTALTDRIKELERKTAVSMGVGSGDGNLFVHGDYESIKAAQALILKCEKLARQVDILTARLKAIESAEPVTLQDMQLEIAPISRGLWDGKPTISFNEEALLRYINRKRIAQPASESVFIAAWPISDSEMEGLLNLCRDTPYATALDRLLVAAPKSISGE